MASFDVIFPGNGLHLHIVADNHALPAKPLPQKPIDHKRRKGGRHIAIQARAEQVTDHDHARPAGAKYFGVGQQIHIRFPALRNIGQSFMGIGFCAALAGKNASGQARDALLASPWPKARAWAATVVASDEKRGRGAQFRD